MLLLALAGSCGTEAEPDGRATRTPTFATDIAPLIHAHCADCHRPGQAAPFSLLSYRDVAKRSELIAEVTASGYMPPWLPEPGIEFVGERRLTASQRQMIRDWHEAGAPRGDAALEPEPPRHDSGWQLGTPDLVVEMAEEFVVPADGRDVFRNFVIPLHDQLPGPRHIEALEIRPGNPAVAHHAILMVDSIGEARRRDRDDAEPGFPGMDLASAEPPDGHFLGWTPGKAPYEPPADMSFELRPDQDLVLQLHMVTTGKRETLRPKIALRFTDRPPVRRPVSLVVWSEDIDIPAGDADWRLEETLVLPSEVDVHAIYPHAHYLGKRLHARARLPNGDVRDLLAIDAWSFDWQDEYRYEVPVRLPAGTTIELDFAYDNSVHNLDNPNDPPTDVRFGDRSVDEMGSLTLQVVPTDPAERPRLRRLQYETIVERSPNDYRARGRLAVMLARQGELADAEAQFRAAVQINDRDPDLLSDLGQLLATTERPAAAAACFERSLATQPDHLLARLNLARLLERADRIREAETQLRELARRQPNAAQALAALGVFLAIRGRFAEALPLQQRAVELQPGDASLHNDLANTLLFGNADPAAAMPHYRRALAAHPQHFAARLNLGRCLLQLGRSDAARAELQRAANQRPDHPEVRDLLRAAAERR